MTFYLFINPDKPEKFYLLRSRILTTETRYPHLFFVPGCFTVKDNFFLIFVLFTKGVLWKP